MLRPALLFCLLAGLLCGSSSTLAATDARWTKDTLTIRTENCGDKAIGVAELRNDGQLDVLVEKIEIVDDAEGIWTIIASNPPSRLGDFVLAPSPQPITYTIQLASNSTTNEWHSAHLVCVTTTGNDTILIEGFRAAADIHWQDTVADAGTHLIGEDHFVFGTALNFGRKDFVISGIKIEGNMNAVLNEVDTGAVFLQQVTHNFTVSLRGDSAGEGFTHITFFGDECDEPVHFSIKGMYTAPKSVAQSYNLVTGLRVLSDRLIFDSEISASVRYHVFDMLGKEALSGSLPPGETADLSQLKPGTYIAVAESGKTKFSCKFATW